MSSPLLSLTKNIQLKTDLFKVNTMQHHGSLNLKSDCLINTRVYNKSIRLLWNWFSYVPNQTQNHIVTGGRSNVCCPSICLMRRFSSSCGSGILWSLFYLVSISARYLCSLLHFYIFHTHTFTLQYWNLTVWVTCNWMYALVWSSMGFF